MTEAYVLGGVRTPFTRYGGTLSGIRADDLLGMTMKGACDRLGVPLIPDTAMGCASSTVKWHAQQGIPAYNNQRSTWSRGLRTERSTLAVQQSTKRSAAVNADVVSNVTRT
jgi:acetyl-CoA acetyltransferase